jgi:hypothetical protein
MTAIRFTIETTFDLASRGGILTPGELASGVIRGGTVLRIEGTDRNVQVLAVELLCSAGSAPATSRVTLMMDRKDAPMLQPGTVLVSPS